MSAISWKGGSGDWSNPAYWSGGVVPTGTDDVTIGVAGGYTVTISVAEKAHSLTMTDGGAALSLGADLTVKAGLTLTGGVVNLGAGDVLTASGPNSFGTGGANGATLEGTGTLSTGGTTTLVAQTGTNYDLYLVQTGTVGASWLNTGTVLMGGEILVGTYFSQTATIDNTGTFELTTSTANIVSASDFGDRITVTNAGLLEKTTASGSGNISLAAVITNTGTIAVQSGTLSPASLTNLSGTTLTGGAYQISANSALELANNTTIVTDAADITLSGAGSSIQSLNTSTNTQTSIDSTLATIAAGGALRLLAGRNFTAVAQSGSFTDAGVLQLGGGTFTATTLNISAKKARVTGFGNLAAAVTNTGTIQATGGTLTVTGSLSGKGTLIAAARATLDLSGLTSFSDLARTTLAHGSLTADANGVIELANNARIVTDNARITLSGAGSSIQSLDTSTNTQTNIDATLAAIGATGTLTLAAGRDFVATGNAGSLTDQGALVLTAATFQATLLTITGSVSGAGTLAGAVANAGTITATGGTLALTGALSGAGALQAGAGAVLALSGGGSIGGALSGAGTVELSGAASFAFAAGIPDVAVAFVNQGNASLGSGALRFLDAVTNDGTLVAQGAAITLDQTLGGTGTLEVGGGGSASLMAGSVAGASIDFLPSLGALDLAAPLSFLGTIAGFAAGDTIDLLATPETRFGYSGGVLTVRDGSTIEASLHFAGSYTKASFHLASDGAGGTLITHT